MHSLRYGEKREGEKDWTYIQRNFGISSGMSVPPLPPLLLTSFTTRYSIRGIAYMRSEMLCYDTRRTVCVYGLKVQKREEKDSRYMQETSTTGTVSIIRSVKSRIPLCDKRCYFGCFLLTRDLARWLP